MQEQSTVLLSRALYTKLYDMLEKTDSLKYVEVLLAHLSGRK